MKNEDLRAGPRAIRLADPERRLHPKAVVETVRGNEAHPLRVYFTWDAG